MWAWAPLPTPGLRAGPLGVTAAHVRGPGARPREEGRSLWPITRPLHPQDTAQRPATPRSHVSLALGGLRGSGLPGAPWSSSHPKWRAGIFTFGLWMRGVVHEITPATSLRGGSWGLRARGTAHHSWPCHCWDEGAPAGLLLPSVLPWGRAGCDTAVPCMGLVLKLSVCVS